MIEATGTRLWMVHFYQEQLKAQYARLRKVMLRRSQLKGQLNDKSNGIKSTKVKKRKNLRNDGHEGGEA